MDLCGGEKVMKNKRKRWYLLWFVGSLIWMTNFFDSFGKDGLDFWVSMQLLTAILFFAAGIVGYISYEKHDRDQ